MPLPEDIASVRRRLAQYRRNLQKLLEQQAEYGDAVIPLQLTNSLDNAREQIRQLKAMLRNWGEVVDDRPDDGLSIDQVAKDLVTLRSDTIEEIRKLKINAFRIHLTLPFESGKIKGIIGTSITSFKNELSADLAHGIVNHCIMPEISDWSSRNTLSLAEMEQKIINRAKEWVCSSYVQESMSATIGKWRSVFRASIEDIFHPIYKEHGVREGILAFPIQFDKDLFKSLINDLKAEYLIGRNVVDRLVHDIVAVIVASIGVTSAGISAGSSAMLGPVGLALLGGSFALIAFMEKRETPEWVVNKCLKLDIPKVIRPYVIKKAKPQIDKHKTDLQKAIINSIETLLGEGIEERMAKEIANIVNVQATKAAEHISQ